jgi:hypothetical protein
VAVVLLACIALGALAVYLLLVFGEVPGAIEERFGELEGLPRNLGEWEADEDSAEGRAARERGQVRERRTWREPGVGWLRQDRLVLQVRYKNRESGAVERSEADRPLRRRRIKRG